MSSFRIAHPSKVCAPQQHCITETYSETDIESFLSDNKNLPEKHKEKVRKAAKHFLIDKKIGEAGGLHETRHAAAVLIVTALIGGGISYTYSSIRYALLITGWLPELCGTSIISNFLHDIAQAKIGGPSCYNKAQQWRDTMQYLMGPTGLLSAYGLTTASARKNFNAAVHKTERLLAEWTSTTPPKSLSKKSVSSKDSGKLQARSEAFDKMFSVANKHNPPAEELPVQKMQDALVGLLTNKKPSSIAEKKSSGSRKKAAASAKKTSSGSRKKAAASRKKTSSGSRKKAAASAKKTSPAQKKPGSARKRSFSKEKKGEKSSSKKITRRNSTRRA